jgi:hypothetical protein
MRRLERAAGFHSAQPARLRVFFLSFTSLFPSFVSDIDARCGSPPDISTRRNRGTTRETSLASGTAFLNFSLIRGFKHLSHSRLLLIEMEGNIGTGLR